MAYIYFHYKRHEEQTIANIVRALLMQVLQWSDVIPPPLEAAYKGSRDRHTIPTHAMFSQQLTAAFAGFSSAFLILDALDECGEENLKAVIDLIRHLSGSGVNVFCTSRTHLINLGELLQTRIINIEARREDVRSYLANRLSKENRFDGFANKINDRLSINAQGE